jgi:hypothetical protein
MTTPPVVRFFLSLYRQTDADVACGGWMGGGGKLYVRNVPTWFLPLVGDDVMLWPTEEEGDSGPTWEVKRRYWRPSGAVDVELIDMQVDPPEEIVKELRTTAAPGLPPYRRTWWTNIDGDPEAQLLAGGWQRYRGLS